MVQIIKIPSLIDQNWNAIEFSSMWVFYWNGNGLRLNWKKCSLKVRCRTRFQGAFSSCCFIFRVINVGLILPMLLHWKRVINKRNYMNKLMLKTRVATRLKFQKRYCIHLALWFSTRVLWRALRVQPISLMHVHFVSKL